MPVSCGPGHGNTGLVVANNLSGSMPSSAAQRRYIPHIDGLRTLAVMSVFLYHLDVDWIGGGFVGVDVFFVISGYLITQIIKRGSEENHFSFSGFYARRVRRLFPALFVVICLSTLWGAISLSPTRLMELAQSGTAAILSISNVYFYFNSDYFDAASSTQIFLHTWSLSVEEQFYLVWPTLIFLAVVLLSNRGQWLMMFALVLLGTAVSFFVTRADPNLAFYMAPFRLAEFALGGLLCWVTWQTPPRWLGETLTLLALAALVWSFAFVTDVASFPGLLFLVPCIATTVLIWSGSHSNFAAVVLGNPVMAYIGRLSYSLYLYHWVVILCYQYEVTPWLELSDQLLIIVIALLLSVASYHWIEKPLRGPSRFWQTNTHVAAVFVLLVFILVSIFAWIVRESGFPERVPQEIREIVVQTEAEKAERFEHYQALCRERSWHRCDQLSETQRNVVILGDSHGIDGLNTLAPLNPDLHFILAALGGCPPMTPDDFAQLVRRNHPNYEKCREHVGKLSAPGFYKNIDYLVFSLSYSWFEPKHLRSFLSTLPADFRGEILIFGNAPSYLDDLPELVVKRGIPARLERYVANYLLEDTWSHDAGLAQLADDYGGLFVSKTGFFCDQAVRSCRLFYGADRKLLTYDRNHLSVDAASEFGQWFLSEHPAYFLPDTAGADPQDADAGST